MEQLKIFYDLDKMQEITDRLAAINADESLSPEFRVKLTDDLMESLSDEEKREFHSYVRTVNTEQREPFKERFCGQKDLRDKIALIEFSNIQYSYCQTVAFFGMISYMMARAEQYKGESREHIHAFMDEVFGGHSDKYMGTIYDLYYKNNKALRPDYVPEVDPKVFGEYMPSVDQWNNYVKYCGAKFHELRGLVSALMGFRPSHDAVIHVHGIFDSPRDPELTKYINANYMRFDPVNELLPVPVGETRLIDQYKEYRSGTVLFDPSNPDLEILHSNRVMTSMNEHGMFKKRLSKIEGRMTKEELAKIKAYRTELHKLQNTPVADRTQLMDHKIDVLKKKINSIQEAHVTDNEVMTKVITINKAKGVSVDTCAAPATK